MGYVDFFDMKVSQAEGFDKKALFKILDTLLDRSAPIREKAWASLVAKNGTQVLKPWNQSFAMSGEIRTLQDPYFPFANAVDVWSRSFAALGIKYAGSTMYLDLCDRQGKYSNGFCHWPIPGNPILSLFTLFIF